MSEATKALNEINNKKEPFYGKNVAVDWCLPKNVFLKNSSNLIISSKYFINF
jgi:hypothetical protein